LSFVDLHTHSTASDGTIEPDAVVRLALEAGLTAVALTDHDTIAGIEPAQAEAKRLGIDFIAGIEISCEYPRPGTMHLLGYGIDPTSQSFRRTLADLVEARDERNARIVKILQSQGIPIKLERVTEIAGGGVVGRPHIARALVELNVVKRPMQAFKKYLGPEGIAYVDKERLDAKQAIELIHSAGGIVSLAHPTQLRKQNRAQLRNEIKNLADIGLDAVEVIHSDHRESTVQELSEWAEKYGLLTTGGSDFHGSAKPHISIGWANRRRVPREWFDAMVERLRH
jgi:predicted metal-dependent phosphoesterase TrpH